MRIWSYWIKNAAAVLQLLSIILRFTDAENLAERSFLSSNPKDLDFYSTRFDSVDAFGARNQNGIAESNSIHEIYATKGKDGQTQRIHYAEDEKGIRANINSNSLSFPENYFPVLPQFPYVLPISLSPESQAYSTFYQNALPQQYVVNRGPQNAYIPTNYLSNVNWYNPSGAFENPVSYQNNNQEGQLNNKQMSVSTKSILSDAVSVNNIPNNSDTPAVTTNSAIQNSLISARLSNLNLNTDIPTTVLENSRQTNNSPIYFEPLVFNSPTDIQKIAKTFKPSSSTYKNIPHDSVTKSTDNEVKYNPILKLPLPVISSINSQSFVPSNYPKKETSNNRNDENKLKIFARNEKKSDVFPPKITKPSKGQKTEQINKVLETETTTVQEKEESVERTKLISDLEKIYSDSLSANPVSTVFDISDANGRYYYYILNKIQPILKTSLTNKKYFSSGDALLKLLNETGISFKKEDVTFSGNGNNEIPDKNNKLIQTLSNENNGESTLYQTNNIDKNENSLVQPKLSDTNKSSEEKSVDNKQISQNVIKENQYSTETIKPDTTVPKTEKSFLITKEEPSTKINVTESSYMPEVTETSFPDRVKSTQEPDRKNITNTEDSILSTIVKGPMNIIMVPFNWLHSLTSGRSNKSIISENYTDTINANSTMAMSIEESLESTTALPKTTFIDQNGTEASNNNNFNGKTTVVELNSTTLAETSGTILADDVSTTTSASEKIEFDTTTTALSTESSQLQTTTTEEIPIVFETKILDDFFNSKAENTANGKVSEEKDTKNEDFVHNTQSDITSSATTEIPSLTTINKKGETLNSTTEMLVLQVPNMKEFMSRVDNLPERLKTLIKDQDKKKNTDNRKRNPVVKLKKTKVPNNSKIKANNTTTSSKKSSSSSLSKKSLRRQEVPSSNLLTQNRLKKDDVPPVEFSLIHPLLLQNNERKTLQFSAKGIRDILGLSKTPVEIKHSGIIELILGDRYLTGNDNVFQSSEIFNQGPITRFEYLDTTSERENPVSSVTNDRFNRMDTSPLQNFNLVNDMISHNPSQHNPQLPAVIDVTNLNLPSKEAEYTTRDLTLIPPVHSRIPEESPIIEEIYIESDSFRNNNSMDYLYGNAFIDIPRINVSNDNYELQPDVEIIEYIPADSVRNNVLSNPSRSDNFNLQDPVYILEEYEDIPITAQQSTANGITNQRVLASNAYDVLPNTYNEPEILVIEDSSKPFGTRIQSIGDAENSNRQQTPVLQQTFNQIRDEFERSSSLSRAPWKE